MTIKRKRIYEIALIACCCVIIALTAYMGITAMQKSMKLNLSFTASPVVYCQMKIGEELVFDNLSSQIGDGVENLSGNTLTFNQDKLASTIGVESFSLTLKNYNETGSSILVEFQNATISGKTGYSEIIASGNSSTFAVTPLNLMGISMTKVTPVALSLGAGVTLTSSNILTSTSGAQCLPFGEDLQATISLESSYENPKFTFNGNTYDITNNQLTIPAEDLTGGDVSVEVEAESSTFVLTLNKTVASDYIDAGFGVIATNDSKFNIYSAMVGARNGYKWVSTDSGESEIEFPTAFSSGMTPIKDQYPNSQFKYIEYYDSTSGSNVSYQIELSEGYRVFVFSSVMPVPPTSYADYFDFTSSTPSVSVKYNGDKIFYFDMLASPLEIYFTSYRKAGGGGGG